MIGIKLKLFHVDLLFAFACRMAMAGLLVKAVSKPTCPAMVPLRYRDEI